MPRFHGFESEGKNEVDVFILTSVIRVKLWGGVELLRWEALSLVAGKERGKVEGHGRAAMASWTVGERMGERAMEEGRGKGGREGGEVRKDRVGSGRRTSDGQGEKGK